PRDADSRTLAYSLYKKFEPRTKKYVNGPGYLQVLKPDVLMIENVKEFRQRGALDENGKSIYSDKGREFLKWEKGIKDLGYESDWNLLNSANYGGHTTRTRLFGAFVKKGQKIAWPVATHSDNPE